MDRTIVNPWKWQDQYAFVQAVEVSGAQRVLYSGSHACTIPISWLKSKPRRPDCARPSP